MSPWPASARSTASGALSSSLSERPLRVDVAVDRSAAVGARLGNQCVALDGTSVERLVDQSLEAVSARVVRRLDQPMRRKDRQAGIGHRDEAHQHVAVVSLPADLVRIRARGLVAMVAVGDQQLGVRKRLLDLADHAGVAHAPETVNRAIGVGDLSPWPARGGGVQSRRGASVRHRDRARRSATGSPSWPASGATCPPWRRDGCARAGGSGPVRRERASRARRSRCARARSRPAPCTSGSGPTAPARCPERSHRRVASSPAARRRARTGRHPAAGRSTPRCTGCGRQGPRADRRR